jgi:aspartate oxidase
VAVVTKRELNDGSSAWAQGGMAAVLAEGDSLEQHVDDTLIAGAGLCDLPATRFVVEHAPEAIAWLRKLGVPFQKTPNTRRAAPDARRRPQPAPHRACGRRHRRRRAAHADRAGARRHARHHAV